MTKIWERIAISNYLPRRIRNSSQWNAGFELNWLIWLGMTTVTFYYVAVGFRYSMYVRRTCIQCIRSATNWGIYLRSRSRRKIFICVPTSYSATGEQPLVLRGSIACCCVYSEFVIVWLWVRWIRISYGDGYLRIVVMVERVGVWLRAV